MNILVLNGSPRADGNTTAMVNAFVEGASENGHKITVVDAGNLSYFRGSGDDCFGISRVLSQFHRAAAVRDQPDLCAG